MYDFHKIKQEGDSIVFRNELFTRNGQYQIFLFQGSAQGDQAQGTKNQEAIPSGDLHRQPNKEIQRPVVALKEPRDGLSDKKGNRGLGYFF